MKKERNPMATLFFKVYLKYDDNLFFKVYDKDEKGAYLKNSEKLAKIQ